MSTPAVSIAQVKKERLAQIASRAGVASANPPSTNLPASIHLESTNPPPIPATGKVPFMSPVETPRAAEAARMVNNTPPNMSVNLTEGFTNEAFSGHVPLDPTLISTGSTGQEMEGGRPGADEQKFTSANPANVNAGNPIINPQQPTVTMPVVAPPPPENLFV